MQFYKPNSKVTGHAIDLNFNSKAQKLYVQIVKQTDWNEDSRTGTFKGGDKFNVTFNGREIGALLNTIERGIASKLFHKSEKGDTSITFDTLPSSTKTQEVKKPRNGITISINPRANEGQSKEDLLTFGFWFDEPEARLLKEYLQFVLNHFFSADYSEQKQARAKYAAEKKNRGKSDGEPQQEDNSQADSVGENF